MSPHFLTAEHQDQGSGITEGNLVPVSKTIYTPSLASHQGLACIDISITLFFFGENRIS